MSKANLVPWWLILLQGLAALIIGIYLIQSSKRHPGNHCGNGGHRPSILECRISARDSCHCGRNTGYLFRSVEPLLGNEGRMGFSHHGGLEHNIWATDHRLSICWYRHFDLSLSSAGNCGRHGHHLPGFSAALKNERLVSNRGARSAGRA